MVGRRSLESPASSVYSSVESFKDTECAIMPVTAFGDDDSVRPFPVVKPPTGKYAQVPVGSDHRIYDSGPLVEHSSFIDMENRHHHNHHISALSTKSCDAVVAPEPHRVITPKRSMRKSVSSFIGMVGESIKLKTNNKKNISFLQTVILVPSPFTLQLWHNLCLVCRASSTMRGKSFCFTVRSYFLDAYSSWVSSFRCIFLCGWWILALRREQRGKRSRSHLLFPSSLHRFHYKCIIIVTLDLLATSRASERTGIRVCREIIRIAKGTILVFRFTLMKLHYRIDILSN